MRPSVTFVIPCYNEAARLPAGALMELVRARGQLRLLLVDDGSTDGTLRLLEEVAREEPARASVLALDQNRGKAEAVRLGLVAALAAGAEAVGYADADLSTPVPELIRLVDALDASAHNVVLGARVRLLGSRIDRRPVRHYLGRVFATIASLALRLPVYDTQCGAKLFRASRQLEAALRAPFRSPWAFDVELLDRLVRGSPGSAPVPVDEFVEIPLRAWSDVPGSKLRASAMFKAGLVLLWLLVRRLWTGRAPTALPAGSGAGPGSVAAEDASAPPTNRTGTGG